MKRERLQVSSKIIQVILIQILCILSKFIDLKGNVILNEYKQVHHVVIDRLGIRKYSL